MTKNNRYKKAARERMAVTGESYTTALLHTEQEAAAQLSGNRPGETDLQIAADRPGEKRETAVEVVEVIWLGDESDEWFVQGTTDVALAKQLVAEDIKKTYTFSANEVEEGREIIGYMEAGSFKSYNDWFWRDPRPEDAGAFGDCFVDSRTLRPEFYEGQELVAGVKLSY